MFKRKENNTMYLDSQLVEDLENRLKRIEGHVRGINRMLDEKQPCDQILTQIAGVKAAMNQVAIKLLEGHLEMCVAESVRRGDGSGAVAEFKASLQRVLRQS